MLATRFFATLVCACWLAAVVVEQAVAQPAITPEAAAEVPAVINETPESSHIEPPPQPIDKGDHAWMLVSSALVLMMTAPGLALFYCGLVRKKNVLSVMMQCVFLMALMTVIWALWGYSLAFGGVPGEANYNPWIGNTDFLFMRNVQPFEKDGAVIYPVEGTIPRLTHMLFQGMFFIITPALICGAFAERMKFSTMVVFMILWGTLIYCPLCHWVWDGGLLAWDIPGGTKTDGALVGALDFAGGTVVHISSGVSALVCALVMGKRLGFKAEPMPPHNLTYTTAGAALLWVGWFGFNTGSALAATEQAAAAFTATHFAAAAGGLAWAVMEWITRAKPSVLGTCSGVVAGLVCITPASGFVQPMPALAMGAAAGVICFLACTTLKTRLGYDDSLDAFGVHGVGGTLGALLTGIFATKIVGGGAVPLGLLEEMKAGAAPASMAHPGILAQAVAAGVTWVAAAVGTFVILKVLDVAMGLRVSQREEIQGLDLSQHGEEGYIFI
ncbi:MAG TPA: ammonium transporter [Pirellulales bacterium]|nr:ammonium transporter [Pirellulales bacterium]